MLFAHDVDIDTLDGRALIRHLSLSFGKERVAVVGRNGVGKSTLLRVLAQEIRPTRGRIEHRGAISLVSQHLTGEASPGQLRRAALEQAFRAEPELLFLDEPRNDLDARGRSWLFRQLRNYAGALMVVSTTPTCWSSSTTSL